jgi:CAAX protease family protein
MSESGESRPNRTAPIAGPAVTADWRQSRWLAVGELALVVLVFVADAYHLIFFSKTPVLFALAWISLRVRGIGWRNIGFARFRTWTATLGLGLSAGLLMEAFELFVSQPLLVRWIGKEPDLSDFNMLSGNPGMTLLFLALAWTLAAFGEEMVHRGYLMNRVADLFNRTRGAWIISLVVVHIGFGIGHAYQGPTGAIDEALMGLLLGVLYLSTGRNLSVPIVAHGVADSIDFILMFLGKYPGM